MGPHGKMRAVRTQWDVAAVAAELGVKPATVRAYMARGQMPTPDGRIGGSPWWFEETIIEWIPTRRRGAGTAERTPPDHGTR